MAIRDFLKRRRNEAVLFVLQGIAFCVLAAVFAPDSFWLNWLSLAALFAGLVAVIVLLYRTSCPQCQRPLGSIAARAANGWAKTRRMTPDCPICGRISRPSSDPRFSRTPKSPPQSAIARCQERPAGIDFWFSSEERYPA